MSLSLLMALLEPNPADKDPNPDSLKSDYENWTRGSEERQELVLQALYLALNEVLYDQATVDPAARLRNREIYTQPAKYVPAGETEPAQAGRGIGTLLAKAVSNDPGSHPLHPEDIVELRRKLREELREHLNRLRKQVETVAKG
jgi:hypothetical protein